MWESPGIHTGIQGLSRDRRFVFISLMRLSNPRNSPSRRVLSAQRTRSPVYIPFITKSFPQPREPSKFIRFLSPRDFAVLSVYKRYVKHAYREQRIGIPGNRTRSRYFRATSLGINATIFFFPPRRLELPHKKRGKFEFVPGALLQLVFSSVFFFVPPLEKNLIAKRRDATTFHMRSLQFFFFFSWIIVNYFSSISI